MDLQNLPENVLFKICRYADDYKWNLLLTSKYFNDFIGRNQKLCGDYTLVIDRDTSLHTLKDCKRCFTTLLFESFDFVYLENWIAVTVFLNSIGLSLKSLILKNGSIKVCQLSQLLSFVPNIQTIDIHFVEIKNPTEELREIAHQFNCLKSLVILTFDSEFYSPIFKKVKSLTGLDISGDFNMVSRQMGLKRLYMDCCSDFDNLPNNEELQLTELKINIWVPLNERSIEILKNFVKLQKNIKIFYIHILHEIEKYNEIFAHVLKLNTLQILQINSTVVVDHFPPIRNNHVEQLIFGPNKEVVDLTKYFRYFPKIKSLAFSFTAITEESMHLINNSSILEDLFLFGDRLYMLFVLMQINLKNLKKLHIRCEDCPPYLIYDFLKRHEKIVHLELNIDRMLKSNDLYALTFIFQNLKDLNYLRINMSCSGLKQKVTKMSKLIRTYAPHLQTLNVKLGEAMDGNGYIKMSNALKRNLKRNSKSYFRRVLPNLKYDVFYHM